MNSKKLKLIPKELRQIPSPPKQLFHAGAPLSELLKLPRVAIVGSRNISPYGKQVTSKLAEQLAEQGIVIVSGLALGVDGLAHQAALATKGLTIAVLPGPIEDIVPAQHAQLAQQIVEQGGALVSEYVPGDISFKTNFVARNRLVAGLAQAVLITEAAEGSGSLHTARFALKQGKPVLAVPGNITSPGSVGTNSLIKDGATAVTSYLDVLQALDLEAHQIVAHEVRGQTTNEQILLDLMLRGINDGESLLQQSKLSVTEFSQVITMLELRDQIRNLGANQWAIR